MGIDRTRTSAYHPQGNGQVERFNRTLKTMLSKMIKDNQRDWDVQLPRALFAYRTSLHESTGFSPYYVNFGRSPTLPVDVMLGRLSSGEEEGRSIPQYVQEVRQSLKAAYSVARQRLTAAHQRQKELSDRTSAGCELKVGDRVWLYVPAVKVGRSRKLASLWRGPYTIVGKTSSVNYRIQLIGATAVLIVHRNRLKICHGEPGGRAAPKSSTSHSSKPTATLSEHTAPATLQPHRTFADVTAGRSVPARPAAYASSMDYTEHSCSARPQRVRQPPARYGSFVGHRIASLIVLRGRKNFGGKS